jgi:Holliday junction resolvasome RuvABC endonuclease subunit
MAILTAYGDENKVPYLGIPVGTIKRHVTGKGTASKDEVIEWAKSKGFRPGDDNEADALAIADLVMNGDPTARASVTKKRKVKSK